MAAKKKKPVKPQSQKPPTTQGTSKDGNYRGAYAARRKKKQARR